MKKIILVFLTLACLTVPCFPVYAAHLICDPNSGIDSYVFTGMPSPLTNTATGASVKADGSLYLDISSMPTGSYSITVKACKTDAVWGQACSASVNFILVRPTLSAPPAPGSIGLVP